MAQTSVLTILFLNIFIMNTHMGCHLILALAQKTYSCTSLRALIPCELYLKIRFRPYKQQHTVLLPYTALG